MQAWLRQRASESQAGWAWPWGSSQPQSPQSALVLEERTDAAPTDAVVSSRLLLFVCGRGFLRRMGDLFRCRAQQTALQLEEEDAVVIVDDDEEEEP